MPHKCTLSWKKKTRKSRLAWGQEEALSTVMPKSEPNKAIHTMVLPGVKRFTEAMVSQDRHENRGTEYHIKPTCPPVFSPNSLSL